VRQRVPLGLHAAYIYRILAFHMPQDLRISQEDVDSKLYTLLGVKARNTGNSDVFAIWHGSLFVYLISIYIYWTDGSIIILDIGYSWGILFKQNYHFKGIRLLN